MTRLFRSKSATPVFADANDAVVVKSSLLRDLLAGVCSTKTLQSARTEVLERLLFKVLGMHSSGDAEALTNLEVKPPWWPDDVLPFHEMQKVRQQVNNVMMTWHSTLSAVLDACVKYYAKNDRKPAPTMQSLKRPTSSTSNAGVPLTPKRLGMDVYENLDRTLSPVVVLRDVLKAKYPVIDKHDYMNFLKLQPKNDHIPSTLPSKILTRNARAKRYPHTIPFSSVYGRKLVLAESYASTDRHCERKRDWTNAYLTSKANNPSETSSESSDSENTSDVTHIPSSCQCRERRYSFPRRQHRQHRNAIDSLRRAFCRPLTVRLKRLSMDVLQPHLMKKRMCRRVSVYVDKRETDQFYQRSP